jgi:hypothetical protein
VYSPGSGFTVDTGSPGEEIHPLNSSENVTITTGDEEIQDQARLTQSDPVLPDETETEDEMQESGYALTLQPGWNFISTPWVLTPGSDTALVFEDVDTAGHSLYSWNNSSWTRVHREDLILPLHAYWIFSRTGTAVPLSFDPGTIPVPVRQYAGWNAIGFPGIQEASAHDALSSLGDSWNFSLGFNASLQMNDVPVMREEGGEGRMYPSRGYWLFMDHEWDLQPVTG